MPSELDQRYDAVLAAVTGPGGRIVLEHDGAGPFAGLANPSRVARYHSLCTRDLPERFTVHAAVDGMAMAFSDLAALQAGLQFHPESILTTHGDAMLVNLMAMFG